MEELFFCDELLSEILIRLPVKALYRSSCVCKHWEYLISSDPIFIKRLKSLPPPISGFFFRRDHTLEDNVEFYHSGARNRVPSDLAIDINLAFRGLPVSVVDSNKGNLLLAERYPQPYSTHYFVCNPVTKQCIALPGHDHKSDHENTLLYCYTKKESETVRTIEFQVIYFCKYKEESVEIETYSSETDKWRMSEISIANCRYKTVIDNSLFSSDCYGKNAKVDMYNFKDGSTCSIKLPPVEGQLGDGFFGESAGSVYYVVTSLTAIQAWVLVDGIEWSLVHSITKEIMMDHFPRLALDCVNYIRAFLPAEQKLLLKRARTSMLFLYHLETGKIELMNDFRPDFIYPFIPYALPACVPLFRKTSGIMPKDIICKLDETNQRSVHNTVTTAEDGSNRFEVLNSIEGDMF